MFGSGKKGNAAKKAYEIAYALFRVSAKIAELGIKEKLESQAIDLLISTNAEEYGNAAKAIAAIDTLVKFAVDLNVISISNGDILLREIGNMNEIIIEYLDKSDDVDVSKFFSGPAPQEKKENVTLDSFIDSIAPVEPNVIPDPVFAYPVEAIASAAKAGQRSDKGEGRNDKSEEFGKVQSGNPAIILKSGNRQIAILDRIRQSGNCKLREIQEILPDCSERTIRYDLEELIERNLVERIGSGGPAVSYRIRQTA
jgi:hypothetical protein